MQNMQEWPPVNMEIVERLTALFPADPVVDEAHPKLTIEEIALSVVTRRGARAACQALAEVAAFQRAR